MRSDFLPVANIQLAGTINVLLALEKGTLDIRRANAPLVLLTAAHRCGEQQVLRSPGNRLGRPS